VLAARSKSQAIRERFLSRGSTMVSIPVEFEDPEEPAATTLDAMHRGVDVVDRPVFLVEERFGAQRPPPSRGRCFEAMAIGYEW
jgi:hypothetical protein